MKKSIILNDIYKNKEKLTNNKSLIKKNELLVYSDSNLIYRGFNKVVNIGRLYNIQTLTQKVLNNSSNSYIKGNNSNLYLRCWGVGTGGTVEGDESTPKEVNLDDTDLNAPVAFTNQNYTHEDNDKSKPAYRDNRRKKEFASLTINKNNNDEIYAELKFSIIETELNEKHISELGFYLWDGESDTSNFYLFSKVNIPSIYKSISGSSTSRYDFIYRIYV